MENVAIIEFAVRAHSSDFHFQCSEVKDLSFKGLTV